MGMQPLYTTNQQQHTTPMENDNNNIYQYYQGPRYNMDQSQEMIYDQKNYQPYVDQTSYQVSETAPTSTNDDQWVESAPLMTEPAIVALLNFFMPGLGHLLIGQVEKGMFYIIETFIETFIISILSVVLIGLYLIPFALIFQVFVMIDGYKIAERMKRGYPVMKGECSNRIASLGLKLFIKGPVFVNSDPKSAPVEWR